MKYEAVIGLEVHVQLSTQTKMFCGCRTAYGAEPNTQVCPVCLGYPGAMPAMNQEAVKRTQLTGLMIGCKINPYSKFDRKSYFYPDMPKNYQISQYDQPFCLGGKIETEVAGQPKTFGVTRIHLEEDVAKSTHFQSFSGVDFNRAGVPLMEIVSEPEMHSPDDAFAYLTALKEILEHLGVSHCNAEEGNIRCDVNVSVRLAGTEPFGVKAELKNLNTFKGVHASLEYEIQRQIEEIEGGGVIIQETRRWDADTGMTYSMRTKENAHDYRYFPEPDLMPVTTTEDEIEVLRNILPEAPAARRARFVTQFGVPDYDAGVLVAQKEVADFFERAAVISGEGKAVSNWVMTEMLRLLGERECGISDALVTPDSLAELVGLVKKGVINSNTAKEVFAELFEKGGSPAEMVESRGLAQVSDSGEIENMVDEAIAANPKSVDDYRNGKAVAAKYLVGQVMRVSKGKANAKLVLEMIETKLRNED